MSSSSEDSLRERQRRDDETRQELERAQRESEEIRRREEELRQRQENRERRKEEKCKQIFKIFINQIIQFSYIFFGKFRFQSCI